jgi:hypothetical protein
VVGGFNGASHLSFEITSWTIEPGTAGPQTFFIDGEQTVSFGGDKTTVAVTHFGTGITAVPGHYSTSDVLGFDPPRVSPSRSRSRSDRPGSIVLRAGHAERGGRSVVAPLYGVSPTGRKV